MPTEFLALGVAPRAVSDLAARGIESAFPIQAATLPDALAGRDIAGKAPTGSGKTLAFGLPLVERCGRALPHRPTGLVLVPTRELAGQVTDELRLLARSHGHRVASVYGGVGFGAQRRALREGVEILIACPGRFADLINQGDVRLDDVRVAVIDEADRMADMGFLPEVRRILDRTGKDRQTLLFSATLDGDVDVLVRLYQRNAARHELEGDDGKRPDATHLFWRTSRETRTAECAAVIVAAGPSMVFCRTRHGADRLTKRLGQAGVDAVAIHGGRSQAQRDRALQSFVEGRVLALIATDVAARGIHVDDVAAVVHFDPPADHKDYLHRSGRTARAGAAGVVVSLVAEGERAAVTKIQRALDLPSGLTDTDLGLIPGAPPRVVRPVPPPRRDRPERAERPARQRDVGVRPDGQVRTPRARHDARPADAARSGGAGTLKFFDARKGYGFIARAGQADLFVHVSALGDIAPSDLADGLPVSYRVEPGRRGEQAASVRVERPRTAARHPEAKRRPSRDRASSR
ncbi:MAG: DEAD/DEAH box helicase [Acidimicrobiales bacterium]